MLCMPTLHVTLHRRARNDSDRRARNDSGARCPLAHRTGPGVPTARPAGAARPQALRACSAKEAPAATVLSARLAVKMAKYTCEEDGRTGGGGGGGGGGEHLQVSRGGGERLVFPSCPACGAIPCSLPDSEPGSRGPVRGGRTTRTRRCCSWAIDPVVTGHRIAARAGKQPDRSSHAQDSGERCRSLSWCAVHLKRLKLTAVGN